MTDDSDLPIVDPSAVTEHTNSPSDLPPVAGVVLAAGMSSRFGESNKLLAMIDGEPLVRHAPRSFLDKSHDQLVAQGFSVPFFMIILNLSEVIVIGSVNIYPNRR